MRNVMSHTAVSAIKASSVTIWIWQNRTKDKYAQLLCNTLKSNFNKSTKRRYRTYRRRNIRLRTRKISSRKIVDVVVEKDIASSSKNNHGGIGVLDEIVK